LTNDGSLTDAQVCEAHKRQPSIEKRFAQTKTVFEIAPVLLKNEGRIEALFFVYFLALLVQALIERELRLAMQRDGVETLALYPEERNTHRPTAEQVLRLFSLTQRHVLEHDGGAHPQLRTRAHRPAAPDPRPARRAEKRLSHAPLTPHPLAR